MHSSSHLSTTLENQFQFSEDWILYVDESIIVANKPSGLLSVPGRGPDKQECLLSHLQAHYPDALIVHRLDMDTSGIMLLARNKEAHRVLSRQFQERETDKSYQAVCLGKPSLQSGSVRLPMRCDWERRPLQMIDFFYGKYAETHWRVLQQYQNFFTVELTPVTGRSHQLRLHMKSLGHPILGDNLYADPVSLEMMPRLMLHAQQLSFTHPETGQAMDISCPPDFEHLLQD
ncbi:RluA family pseudouridine synthase [Thiomicrorhabdus sp. ZW0627]|uniref:RluA family pseudouridine synthase n=1 Tax=Thiomicrorhabdus sp. ZW0627 TaxID=3039774 RepID=UPI002436BA12|nr:RluA family pseudouridine synthase [Thiomicrorhabdus sp. ZW0627]MDG6774642.1 RluA family pseudouridine synthase [Thiomicrorhabdus sp. ZW0627]